MNLDECGASPLQALDPLSADAPPLAWRHVQGQPWVWRGAAQAWPAVRQWTFSSLSALAPELPIELVRGNREREGTHFTTTTWGEHLRAMQDSAGVDQPVANLKEFDLLKQFPALLRDLRLSELFPSGSVYANQAWIGPAGARTGLHFDLLDNLTLMLMGHKRFYLLPPPALKAHQWSSKYERWARLSKRGVDQVWQEAGPDVKGVLRVVDVGPGDALYVPHGWWHEVVNLAPSVLLSGFFGTRRTMWGLWLKTGIVHMAHLAGLWRQGYCTCHPERQTTHKQ